MLLQDAISDAFKKRSDELVSATIEEFSEMEACLKAEAARAAVTMFYHISASRVDTDFAVRIDLNAETDRPHGRIALPRIWR